VTLPASTITETIEDAVPDLPDPDLSCLAKWGVSEIVKVKDPDGAVYGDSGEGECGFYMAVYHQVSLSPDSEGYYTYWRHWVDVIDFDVCCPEA
jgi:hypothetical protein